MLPTGGRQHCGQNNCPKHVELTGIINMPLLLHLVGCLYCLYQWCTVKQISDNEIYLFIKYINSVLWRVAKRLSYIEDAQCLKVNQVVYWETKLMWNLYKNHWIPSLSFLIPVHDIHQGKKKEIITSMTTQVIMIYTERIGVDGTYSVDIGQKWLDMCFM